MCCYETIKGIKGQNIMNICAQWYMGFNEEIVCYEGAIFIDIHLLYFVKICTYVINVCNGTCKNGRGGE